jgi:hypothetical protein
MGKKLIVIALAAVGFASAPRSNAGTEVVEPQYAPQQTYNYAPPPPRPVYYPYPVPVSVVVYPTVAYYPRPVRVYGFHRTFVRPFHRPGHHWH